MNQKKKLLYLITEDWFFCSHFFEKRIVLLKIGMKLLFAQKKNKDKKKIEEYGLNFKRSNLIEKISIHFMNYWFLLK